MSTYLNLDSELDRIELEYGLNANTSLLDSLRGLPFYCEWTYGRRLATLNCCFTHIVGLPMKDNVEHPLYDYEKEMIDYLETDNPTNPQNKHLYILKAAGLGITTLMLYYIGWKSTTNDDWNNSKVCIITAPGLDLTIDIIDRLKNIFRRNDILDFDSSRKLCHINNVTIQAYPSNEGHALKAMRGRTDIKMILCDEASFFDESTIGEVRDTIERYWLKTNPIIVLCSTPNKPGDLMDQIRQEPEDKCIYHRMYRDWTYGENTMWTQQELAFQRLSPSWGREYCLQFAGGLGNVFHVRDIDAAIERGRNILSKYPKIKEGADNQDIHAYTQKSMGLDPGWGSSNFGVCITELVDGMLNVLHAEEYIRPDFNEMMEITIDLMEKYHITKSSGSNIYCDGANPSFITALKRRVNESADYLRDIQWLKDNWGKRFSISLLQNGMLVIPINFNQESKKMLAKAKYVMENDGGYVAIDPKHIKLITALRTAVENGEGMLDKKETVNNDLFDGFRLCLQHYRGIG